MCTYLTKRGATYYFRRLVPGELRPYLDSRREWMISLRSKDREEAKKKIPDHTIASDELIEAARASLACDRVAGRPSSPTSAAAAPAIPEGLSPGAAEQAEYEFQEAQEAAYRWKARSDARRIMRHRLATRRSNELHLSEQVMRDILREREAELAQILAEREEQGAAYRAAAVARADAPLPLLDVFDAYAKEQQLKPTTSYEWRTNIKALVAFLGHDDVRRLTVDDLDRWRDALLKEVTKLGTIRSPTTVKDKYFAALRATLNWALEKRKIKENVALKVVVRVPRKAKLRDSNFTTIEAHTILSATLKPTTDVISEYLALARRWVPWLCAYTGARVNEISQLRGGDVAEIDGIWTVRITPEAGTVKANIARVVPLHPHLIEQGFVAVAAAAEAAPIFYDPSLARKPGAANRHAKKVGERLAQWVRDDVGITDPNIQPNHGWRHTFKSMAIDAGMPERVADAIQGHAPRSVGQTYGSVSLKTLAAAVASLPRYEV